MVSQVGFGFFALLQPLSQRFEVFGRNIMKRSEHFIYLTLG
jgi:hypothetical protein